MGQDHRRQDASRWGDKQEQAWISWDFAVVSAQAFGWQLQQLTGALIAANCTWGAKSVAEVDRRLYTPTAHLAGADRVTRAIAAATAYDRAHVSSGLAGIIRELEHQARTNQQVADAIAGWGHRAEAMRDRVAGAALELRQAYVVAVAGGTRPAGGGPEHPQLGD